MKVVTAVRILILVNLFGVAVVMPSKFQGLSLALLRDLLLAFFVIVVIAVSPRWPKGRLLLEIMIVLLAFLFSVWVASLESFYPDLVAPLYFRILLLFLIVFFLSCLRLGELAKADIFRSIYAMLATYVVLSLLLYALPIGRSDNGAMEGFAGQHFTKFVVVICVLFFLTTLCQMKSRSRSSKWMDLLFLCLSLIVLVLVLQRGAIIATGVGFLICRRSILGQQGPLARIAVISVLVLVAVSIVTDERFLSYAFFEKFGPKEMFSAIVNGEFSIDMVRARGRLQMIEVITESTSVEFFGNGPGLAKSIVGNEYFWGREPHNDLLVFAVDIGVFGLLSVLALLTLSLLVTRKSTIQAGSCSGVLFTSGTASVFGFLAWMAVSNVVIYNNYNFILASIFVLVGKSSESLAVRGKMSRLGVFIHKKGTSK